MPACIQIQATFHPFPSHTAAATSSFTLKRTLTLLLLQKPCLPRYSTFVRIDDGCAPHIPDRKSPGGATCIIKRLHVHMRPL